VNVENAETQPAETPPAEAPPAETLPAEAPPAEAPTPKRRGRPPGSKNRPKEQTAEAPLEPGEAPPAEAKRSKRAAAPAELPPLAARRVTMSEAVASATEHEKAIAGKLVAFYRTELPEFPAFGLAIVEACALHALVNLARDVDPNPYLSATVAVAPALLVVRRRRAAAD